MKTSSSPLLYIFKQTVLEYCSNSSIHGVYYIIEPGRRFCERLFWCLAITTALIFTVLVIGENSGQLSINYTRSYLKSLHHPSYLSSRPAFTFCTNTLKMSRAERLLNFINLPSHVNRSEILSDLKLLHLLIDSRSITVDDLDIMRLHRLQNILNNNSVTTEQVIQQLVQPCSELFVRCIAGSAIVACSKLVFSTRTDLGFCCSLHYKPPPDTIPSMPSYFIKESDKLYLNNYGFESGHAFLLNISEDDVLNPRNPALGAQVFVHGRAQYPQLFSSGNFFSYGWETFIRIQISIKKIAPVLKYLSPNARRCYFPEEIDLKYFYDYTFSNCITEARMDYILMKCKCLPITFPNNGQFKTCTLTDLKCLIVYQFSDKYGYSEGIYIKLNNVKYPCLQKCSVTSYLVHSTSAKFDAPYTNAFRLYDGINTTGLTVVHLFRDSPTIWLHYKDSVFYVWDLIAGRSMSADDFTWI